MRLLKIKEYRKAAGLTQKELGDKVGASPISISFYENEKQSPDVNMLRHEKFGRKVNSFYLTCIYFITFLKYFILLITNYKYFIF